jgi:small subunit ribosomal protein S1
MVHISELAHERIDNIAEQFQKGAEITAAIISIDPVEQRASLSRKRLLPYTPPARDESGVGEFEDRGGRRDRGGDRGDRGGDRGGRRGGRRKDVIDYDYSYAGPGDSSSKTTTKLGDVYADLFAQFGLAAGAAPTAPTKPEKPKEPKPEAPKIAAPASKLEETVDPANAIDAAEAAALLTAAFREGKRPIKADETEETPEESTEA